MKIITANLNLNMCTSMIKFRSIIIKITAFVDSFTVVFKTRILCSGTFLCNWYMRYKLRNLIYRQTGERLHYTL